MTRGIRCARRGRGGTRNECREEEWGSVLQLAKKLSVRGAEGVERGGRQPNEKLPPPSLSATPLQSVMGRHVDTSARLFVVNVVDARGLIV